MKAGVKAICMVAAGFIFITALVFIPKMTAAYGAPIKGKCPRSHVTTTEWSQLSIPMPAKKAREILDGPGKREPGHPHKRRYEICGHENAYDAFAVFWFNKGRLVYGAYVVITIHYNEANDPTAGLVPCPNDPQALGCDPDAVETPPVCTDATGAVVECYFGRLLLT